MRIPKPVLIALLCFAAAWSDPATWNWPTLPSLIPSVAPLTDAGLRVIIVEEAGDRHKLPPAQLLALSATDWRDYVKAQGGEWRVLDQSLTHDQLATEPAWVKQAWDLKREGLPWLIVSNGKRGYAGPLPATAPELLTLIQKYKVQ